MLSGITALTLKLPHSLPLVLEKSSNKYKTQTSKISRQTYCKKFSTSKQIPLMKATYPTTHYSCTGYINFTT
jgi:hypothetical protein